MTYNDAINAGYRPADVTWARGYVSRKASPMEAREAREAGGSRKGQLYVLLPAWTSTRYCKRLYLVPPEGGGAQA